FAGLFVVTHGVAQAGIAERIHSALAPVLGSDATQQTVRFGVFTVAACQIVSNVPFVLLAAQWVRKLADPHLGWLSLALVSTLPAVTRPRSRASWRSTSNPSTVSASGSLAEEKRRATLPRRRSSAPTPESAISIRASPSPPGSCESRGTTASISFAAAGRC